MSQPYSPFGFTPLDRLLKVANEGCVNPSKTPMIIELTSIHPGAGPIHLLYHLTALAALPRDCGGRQSCAVIFDTDGDFDVERLVSQLRLVITTNQSLEEATVDNDATILHALRQVHILRPQSLASLTATLEALSSYLFNPNHHFSFDRQVSFIAIDSASAFYWQDRAETEDAAFFAKTSGEPGAAAPQSGYAALTTALKRVCGTLQCPAIFTSWHLGPKTTASHASRSFRPPLPAPFSTLPTLRLACQRVPVRKFPPMISVDGAQKEAADRRKAVEEGTFECFVNEWGLDERTLRKFQSVGGGFEFKIMESGIHA